ncbi:MAG TPA: hypothetical protein VK544_06930 [Gemmatimonadaceae bacterium]|nr:hypothetical protein [Gemmatimonadaceae bacterium]
MERTDRETAKLDAGADQSDIDQGGVKGRVKGVAASIRKQASTLPAILADELEAGAEALRRRPATTGKRPGTAVAVADNSSITAVTDTLASGMQSSAEWLRDADLDKIKEGVEKQVKEHPGRTLLVALGAGYLLGKVFRR